MKTIAFFNSRNGVGKTLLAYHLAWMLHHLGLRVLVADLDPQAHLTEAFLQDDRLEALWNAHPPRTIMGAIGPLNIGLGDISAAHVEDVDGIGLIPGDLELARFENRLVNSQLGQHHDDAALQVHTAFHRMVKAAAVDRSADVSIIDMGPNFSAINMAALRAADATVVPLAPDTPSVLALHSLGKELHEWQRRWDDIRKVADTVGMTLSEGGMNPIGYVVVQQAAKKGRESTHAYKRRLDQIAHAFHEHVLRDEVPAGPDPRCLGELRHLQGLLAIARDARKPVFDLKAADGAIGSYAMAVKDASIAFENLAREIAKKAGVVVPERG